VELELEVLEQPPTFSVRATLTVEALAPLSIVAKMPGKYYRSQPAPTDEMLYGLLENALGWHIGAKERGDVVKRLQRQHGAVAQGSGVGFLSLLQFHLRFGKVRQVPPLLHYDDLWAQHLKGNAFAGGSREYDYRAIPLMNALASKQVRADDRAGSRKDPAALTDFNEGEAIHLDVLRPYFPQYYVSPTPREFVLPQGPYRFLVETSPDLAARIGEAIAAPAAPLYLGTNDGWVDAEWRVLP